MSSQSPVINMAADYEESILRFAKHLGRDKTRRLVFDVIYGRGEKPRSKKEIAEIVRKEGNTQVIQDALGHLHQHNLITRVENDDQAKDGSRWLYGKEPSIRAHRKEIVKYADNPAAAKKVVTKRRPELSTNVSFVKVARSVVKQRRATPPKGQSQIRLKIAVLVTNPERGSPLQTMVEARDIEQGIRNGARRDEVEVKLVLSPTVDSLIDTLNRYKPDVIHFSGHGGGRQLLFDNERAGGDGGTVLDFDMVARLLGATSAKPKLLVLVACDTVDGADRFLSEVPEVIAMAASIEDEAACAFSARFYGSLSDGVTVAQALEQAKLKLESKAYSDHDLPTLLPPDGGRSSLL